MKIRDAVIGSVLFVTVGAALASASTYPRPQVKYPEVRVKVTDLSGGLLPGAIVRYSESSDPSRAKVAVVKADGYAVFEIDADRTYDLEVWLEGFIPVTLHGVNRPVGHGRGHELHRNRNLTVALNPRSDEVIH